MTQTNKRNYEIGLELCFRKTLGITGACLMPLGHKTPLNPLITITPVIPASPLIIGRGCPVGGVEYEKGTELRRKVDAGTDNSFKMYPDGFPSRGGYPLQSSQKITNDLETPAPLIANNPGTAVVTVWNPGSDVKKWSHDVQEQGGFYVL